VPTLLAVKENFYHFKVDLINNKYFNLWL